MTSSPSTKCSTATSPRAVSRVTPSAKQGATKVLVWPKVRGKLPSMVETVPKAITVGAVELTGRTPPGVEAPGPTRKPSLANPTTR